MSVQGITGHLTEPHKDIITITTTIIACRAPRDHLTPVPPMHLPEFHLAILSLYWSFSNCACALNGALSSSLIALVHKDITAVSREGPEWKSR